MSRLRTLGLAIIAWSLTTGGNAAASDQRVTDEAPELWLEAGISPATPYLQSQSVYTVRLYQGIGLQELEFRAPAAALAEIRPIGERIEEVTRAGRRYRVTERRYALFPFASGELALEPAGITARRFSTAPATPDVVLNAPALKPKVRPIPSGAPLGAWLPARTLAVTESWSPDTTAPGAGQPIQRTIRITAQGIDASQLPELSVRGEGFSAHAAPPALHDRIEGDWNVGTREQTWTIVPTRPGTMTVSGVVIPWWNSDTHRIEFANLPGRSLTIAAAPAAVSDGHTGSATHGSGQSSTPMTPPASSAIRDVRPVMEITPYTIGMWLLVITLTGGLLVALRGRTAAWRRLARACRNNDARAAQAALLQGGAPRASARSPKTLGELAFGLPDDCPYRAELARLERHRYGPSRDTWREGRALAKTLIISRIRPKCLKPCQPPPPGAGRRITALQDGRRATRRQ